MYVYKNECAYVKNKENKTKAKDRYIEKNLKKGDGGGWRRSRYPRDVRQGLNQIKPSRLGSPIPPFRKGRITSKLPSTSPNFQFLSPHLSVFLSFLLCSRRWRRRRRRTAATARGSRCRSWRSSSPSSSSMAASSTPSPVRRCVLPN